jgi:tetratricopeptide (TPR) repeat protein
MVPFAIFLLTFVVRRSIESEVGYEQFNIMVREKMRKWLQVTLLAELTGDPKYNERRIMMGKLNYAKFLAKIDKCDKSLALYQKVLEAQSAAHHPLHRDCGRIYSGIGNTYHITGNTEKALENYDMAIKIQKKELRKDHPFLAATYINVADTHCASGNYEKSLELLLEALRIRKAAVGPDSGELAVIYFGLAKTYNGMINFDKELVV